MLLSAWQVKGGERLKLNFNPDWKFIKSDPPNASAIEFDDRDWSVVSAPHTFNDTDTFDDWSLSGHRGEQNQWSGRTWYRKSFTLPTSYEDKKVFLEFEAVRQIAEVYLNGKLLGISKSGFTPFAFDLTPHLRFGSPNVLAVMCDNRFMKDLWEADGPKNGAATNSKTGGKLADLSAHFNSLIPENVSELQADQIPWNNPHWHPAHGGIYRNVYLHVTDPLHITLPLYSFLQTAGPYVYTDDISAKAATINVEVPVENARASGQQFEVTAQVLDYQGKSVLTLKQNGKAAAGEKKEFKLSGVIKDPKLWEPAYPYLYRVVCSVNSGGATVDTCEIPLGIRAVRWDAQSGFYINGHHLKLHGWGQRPTDEWPGLGTAQPDWVHFFTVQMMKEAGGNFLRWGHSAGGPASIAAADRLGLVTLQPGVDGESDTRGAAWKVRAECFRDTVIYFRNNPSILIWEGGNQKVTREHARELRDLMNNYDPHGGRAYAHRRADNVTAEFMTIGVGTEGGREIAQLPVVEGEYNREESPRRVWDDRSPPNFGYPEAKGQTYQLTSEQFAANEVAHYMSKLGAPDHSGGGNWIFSDTTSGGRVACEVARASGEVDGMRLPKEAYFVCRAMYRADPQVHIIGHWNYAAGTKKDIYVVANGEKVDLFVNGKSQAGGQVTNRYLFCFPDVAWEPGEIKAVSYVGGKTVASQIKRTAGPPVALRMSPISGPGGINADGSDVAFVDVEAVDAKGERCPTLEREVEFAMEGPGTWIGGYMSGRTNSIHQRKLNLECGVNRVAVRASRISGAITISARCDGLQPGKVTLQTQPAEVANGASEKLPELPVMPLPANGIAVAAADTMPVVAKSVERTTASNSGRFTQAVLYSGPSRKVHLELDAQEGKKVYSDRDYQFPSLPEALRGSDFVQATDSDNQYNAVDLIELAVKKGSVVFLAHDDRLPRPNWLQRLFKPTDMTLTINRHQMTVFEHGATFDESLTLGANADNSSVKSCNMYVVFVTASPPVSAELKETRGQ